ncbi:hypothetical protein O987_06350 [Comamonas testosteroni TK102]|uniref:Uncharacterized protein n=1 Tax=Comamonas testosteroni TK102 TaxID=1392005 RepID=A0A076PIG1_COMTE|nr:hypothetical protein O987_06350 [Comamonas testosteroni TK102]
MGAFFHAREGYDMGFWIVITMVLCGCIIFWP